jgi:predicted ATPase/class 3 adenylate cyclase
VHEAPVGTVTFVFTDLEGSTRLWEQHPEAMRDALARHDELLRTAVSDHGGHVVKTTGDGVHAVFASARDALLAAADAQRAMEGEAWERTGALRVRIGVHTGEAEHRDGDYYGTAVNRAARLRAAAHGGQILVSLATEELVRDSLGDELAFVDLGEHRLRDLSRPERVFQVVAPGLPDDFPSLSAVGSVAGNLPAQATSFVGREDAIHAIAAELRDVPLVTITGTGGVGKTRLALQIAEHVAEEYPDGTWLCELAMAGDDEEAVQVVAGALGVTPRPGMTLAESIVDFLRTKQLLLVLDNCEHLLDASGRLAESIVHGCPDVRTIATSREGLAVDGERMRPLRSLSLPDPSGPPDVVVASDSVALFVDRARAARPEFALDETSAVPIAEICRRLDGIPLAIELAAARVVSMSPAEIAALVDERFRLLTGGRRTAVERHQTLRAAVDWSYALLPEPEQRVFSRLSVFAGGFTTEDAAAVVTGDGIDTWDVIDLVGSLVAKSMLTVDDAPSETMRCRALETMRQYGRERLEDTDDPERWRRRHAEHYAAFAEHAGVEMLGPDELVWRRRVMTELDNLRAAVAWAFDAPDRHDREFGTRIVAGLSGESASGASVEVTAWSERALTFVDEMTPAQRASVLSAAAWAALLAGSLGLARERAEAVLREEVRGFWTASAYVQLGYLAAIEDDYERVMAVLEDALGDADAHPDARDAAVGRTTVLIAMAGMRVTGGIEGADVAAAEAIRAAHEARHPTSIANAAFASGLSTWRSDPDHARPVLDEGIALVHAGTNTVVLPMMLAVRALVATRDGDAAEARASLREAITSAHDKGDVPALVTVLEYGIQVWSRFGEEELAATVGGATTGPLAAFSSLPRYEVPHRDEALAGVRAALGEDAYDAAAARGAAMTLDELVALANQLRRSSGL